MLAAARFGDQISHTERKRGLLGGMLAGAALVGAAIFVVGTGGMGAVLIAGAVMTGASVGGSIGSMIGGSMTVPKGKIVTGAATVFVNSLGTPFARSCVDEAQCDDHSRKKIATGSTTVIVEGYPAARVGEFGECAFKISKGSQDVFVGGEQAQCAGLEIASEVPGWLEWTHRIVGWAGALCLLGPAFGLRVAVASVIGTEIGAHVGGEVGQHYFGKWGGVVGSLVGGVIGGGIPLNPRVGSFINRLEPAPGLYSTVGMVPLRLRPAPKTLLPGEGRVGTFRELSRAGSKGDNLTPHHIPSDAYMQGRRVPGYTRDEGISINMEQPRVGGRHRQTGTYGRPPDLTLTPRQALARDIRDARRIYQQDGLYTPEVRRSLQEVVRLNKEKWGPLFDKPPRGR